MDRIEMFKTAYKTAQQDPDSQYAQELRRRIESGAFNNEIKALGISIPGVQSNVQEQKELGFVGELVSAPITMAARPVQAVQQGVRRIQANVQGRKAQDIQNEIDILQPQLEEAQAAGDKEKSRALFEQIRSLSEEEKGILNKQTDILEKKAFSGGVIAEAPENLKDIRKDIGRAAETVAWGVGGGALGGAGKAGVQAAKGVTGQVGKQALRAGIEGGIAGALGGAGSEMQQDEATFGSVLKQGALGGALGAVTGGAIGAASPAIGRVVGKASQLVGAATDVGESAIQKVKNVFSDFVPTREEEIIDLITPEMSKKQLAGALAKGKGVVKRGALFDTVEIAPGKKVIDAFEEVKDIIDPKLTATENLNRARSVIEKEAEALKAKVGDQKGVFTFKELQSKLNKAKLPVGFKREVTEYNKLKDVSNAAMKIARQKGGKISSLLDARKEFDKLVKESFPNLFDATGKPTTTYNAVIAVRDTMNDLIEKSLPKNVGYRASLKKQSVLYDVINALDEKAAREVGAPTSRVTRKIKAISRKNPKATTAAKIAGGLTGAGVAGGIGSAIIN